MKFNLLSTLWVSLVGTPAMAVCGAGAWDRNGPPLECYQELSEATHCTFHGWVEGVSRPFCGLGGILRCVDETLYRYECDCGGYLEQVPTIDDPSNNFSVAWCQSPPPEEGDVSPIAPELMRP